MDQKQEDFIKKEITKQLPKLKKEYFYHLWPFDEGLCMWIRNTNGGAQKACRYYADFVFDDSNVKKLVKTIKNTEEFQKKYLANPMKEIQPKQPSKGRGRQRWIQNRKKKRKS